MAASANLIVLPRGAKLYTSSAVAALCGVKNSAVSNWLRREILPNRGLPVVYARSRNSSVPLWDVSGAFTVSNWHAARTERREGS